MPIVYDIIILLIFWKRPWSRRVKHKSWKNQLAMKENTELFPGKKQNWRKQSMSTSPFEKSYYARYTFFWLNSRIIYTGLHLCPCFSNVNQIFKCSTSLQHCLLLKVSGSMSNFFKSVTIILGNNSKLIMKDRKQKFSRIANYEVAF